MFKCTLNELCQKRGFESPKYTYIKTGQDHNPLYKARVTVNGSNFYSSSAFKTQKYADNDVAEIASSYFMIFSLPIDAMQKSKKLKGTSLSLDSHLNTGTLSETGHESCLSVLPNDTKVSSFDHSLFSIIEPNCIKSNMISEFNPNKSMNMGIPEMMMTRGNVLEVIGECKWNIVSLKSA